MSATGDALKAVPLFRELPGKSLDRIAARALPVGYKAGEVVFREGDPGTGFFVVLSGRVSVSHGGKEAAQLAAGGFFGEMSLLDSFPRSATVSALEASNCLELKREDLMSELRAHPEIAFEILSILSRRVRDLHNRLRHVESSVPAEWLS